MIDASAPRFVSDSRLFSRRLFSTTGHRHRRSSSKKCRQRYINRPLFANKHQHFLALDHFVFQLFCLSFTMSSLFNSLKTLAKAASIPLSLRSALHGPEPPFSIVSTTSPPPARRPVPPVTPLADSDWIVISTQRSRLRSTPRYKYCSGGWIHIEGAEAGQSPGMFEPISCPPTSVVDHRPL
jgi:hypothetical protein